MHSRTTLACVLGLSAVFGACSKSAPDPGKEVQLESLCSEADGSRVRVSGYVRYRRGLLSFCSTIGDHKTCDLALYASAEPPADFDPMHASTGPDPLYAKLSVPVGNAPGEMADLPEKFVDSDVVVHLDDGTRAPEGTHIVVDGTLSVVPGVEPGPAACFVNVEWAAKAP